MVIFMVHGACTRHGIVFWFGTQPMPKQFAESWQWTVDSILQGAVIAFVDTRTYCQAHIHSVCLLYYQIS